MRISQFVSQPPKGGAVSKPHQGGAVSQLHPKGAVSQPPTGGTIPQPPAGGEGSRPHSSAGGAVSRLPQSGVRKPIVVAKIKPPQFEIVETDETATHPAIDLSLIDWVVHPETNDILFFVQGDDWFIDQRLLPSEFVKQAYRETLGCKQCSE